MPHKWNRKRTGGKRMGLAPQTMSNKIEVQPIDDSFTTRWTEITKGLGQGHRAYYDYNELTPTGKKVVSTLEAQGKAKLSEDPNGRIVVQRRVGFNPVVFFLSAGARF